MHDGAAVFPAALFLYGGWAVTHTRQARALYGATGPARVKAAAAASRATVPP